MQKFCDLFPQDWPWNQLESLAYQLRLWNEKINLISRKDIHFLEERHFLPSLAIAKVISFLPQAQILDVGTGGGFPGLPLAICFPQVHFVLLDAVGKKINVLDQIIRALKVSNVTLIKSRIEDYTKQFDFVLGRAVTTLPDFWQWVSKNIAQKHRHPLANGVLYLKGGVLEAELGLLKEAQVRYQEYPLSIILGEQWCLDKSLIHLSRTPFLQKKCR